MSFAKIFITLIVLLVVLRGSDAASQSVSTSISNSNSISISNSNSISISNSMSYSISYSISMSITVTVSNSLVLPAPSMVQNSCPGQRDIACCYWAEPPAYFYPSFNFYYRLASATTFTKISNIQALSLNLDETELVAGQTYIVTVTGVTFNGVESPMAPLATIVLTTPDSRDSTAAAVSNVVITAGIGSITYSYTPGTSIVERINFRAKCHKPSGKPYQIRRNFNKPTIPTKTVYGFKSGSTCRCKLHFLYFDENTGDNADPRYGKKMKFVENLIIF